VLTAAFTVLSFQRSAPEACSTEAFRPSRLDADTFLRATAHIKMGS